MFSQKYENLMKSSGLTPEEAEVINGFKKDLDKDLDKGADFD